MGTYVVGVDGSKGSIEALRYAIEEARVHDATVKAVNAWHTPAILYESGWAPLPVDYAAYPKQAQEVLDRCLEEVGAAESGVEVTTVVHQGQAADVICEEAKGADLLIVGSRGVGGFRGLLLGSVSQQCAHFAPCPILIVPNRTSLKDHEDLVGERSEKVAGAPPV